VEFVVGAILGVVGASLIVGGIVLYRGSTRLSLRALSAAALAAGLVIWALILFITPVPVERVGLTRFEGMVMSMTRSW
jgi:hypothetical protein